MAVIKCKMCGGDMEISADKTFGMCEYCGSTMTLPKVSDDQRAAAFNRGNHFRRAGEFDKALGVYERIVADVASVLGISRAGAYELVRSDGFPALHIGSRIVVPKGKFIDWINANTGA